jgi:hypothetical protein
MALQIEALPVFYKQRDNLFFPGNVNTSLQRNTHALCLALKFMSGCFYVDFPLGSANGWNSK